jgi:hypothetical protein
LTDADVGYELSLPQDWLVGNLIAPGDLRKRITQAAVKHSFVESYGALRTLPPSVRFVAINLDDQFLAGGWVPDIGVRLIEKSQVEGKSLSDLVESMHQMVTLSAMLHREMVRQPGQPPYGRMDSVATWYVQSTEVTVRQVTVLVEARKYFLILNLSCGVNVYPHLENTFNDVVSSLQIFTPVATATSPNPQAVPTMPRSSTRPARMRISSEVFGYEIAFSPSSDALAILGDGLALYRADTLQQEWHIPQELLMSTVKNARLHRLKFSPDGTMLASADNMDDRVFLWDAKTGKFLRALYWQWGKSEDFAWSPDGTMLAVLAFAEWVVFWEPQTGRQLAILLHKNVIVSIGFTPDGKTLLVADGGALWSYNVASVLQGNKTGQQVMELPDEVWGTHVIYGFSPDQTKLVFQSGAGYSVWDRTTSKMLYTLKAERIEWSPDGTLLAGYIVEKSDPVITIWDARTGRQLFTLAGNTRSVGAIAWSPDCKTLASQAGQELILWDVRP